MRVQGIHYDLDALFPHDIKCYDEEELCLKDYEYIKRLYPKEVRWMLVVIEDHLDRYEYEGSPMYAEYPDAICLFHLASEIYKDFTFEGTVKEQQQLKTMIQMMVCHEVYIRRRRHDKFCEKFSTLYQQMNPFLYK